MMTGWYFVETTAQLLEYEQREAVLGDLMEAGENACQGVLSILGLAFRLQVALWKDWRPWLAAFATSLPASFLLMGVSLSVSQSYQRFAYAKTPGPSAFLLLLCQVVLLIGWSWSAGFAVGAISRRTVWVSAILCCSPCLFCLARFHVLSMPRFCLLLFLLPAIWGAGQSLRAMRINLGGSAGFALLLTGLTIATWNGGGHPWWSPRPWIIEGALIWPAWYLVAVAWRQTNGKLLFSQE